MIMDSTIVNKLRFFSFSLIFIFYSTLISAQNNSESYFIVQYFKVEPAKDSEFFDLETTVWMKMHKARIKSNLLDGYFLFRVISPKGSKTEYNYVVVLEYDTAEKLAGHFEAYGVNYTEILDDQEIALALRSPEIKDQVYEEVWKTVDIIMNPATDHPFRFQVFNAMKLKDDVQGDEYQNIEVNYWKPWHQHRIKNNQLHGWGLYNMIIPGGTEREYQWATVDYFDKFIDIMSNDDNAFAKIHGAKNADKYLEETLSKRDLLRTEVRELLESITDDELGI